MGRWHTSSMKPPVQMISRHALHEARSSRPNATLKARSIPNLATLDLNLLRVFDALHEERSVTRAGLRLGVTQSAVSHALNRLRDLLGDELFSKTPDGMIPTAKARDIGPRLRSALASLHAALGDTGFDPATTEHRFILAVDPYARAVLLPRVIAQIRNLAPAVQLRIKPGIAGATDALDSNRLDLAIASYRRVPERFGAHDLLHERHVWALRSDHPAAIAPLTLERLAQLPHLVGAILDDDDADPPAPGHGLERRAIQDDDGALLRALAGIGQQRQVPLTISDSFAALAIVGESDLAALVPYRMGAALAGRFGLSLFDPPYETPIVPLSMVWHRGHGASPAAEWLRGVILDAAQSL